MGDESEAPLRDEIARRCGGHGWPLSIAQIVLTDQGLMENGERWEDLDDDRAQMVLENWKTFEKACADKVAKLKKQPAKGGAA